MSPLPIKNDTGGLLDQTPKEEFYVVQYLAGYDSAYEH
jgi:hypothetical protein